MQKFKKSMANIKVHLTKLIKRNQVSVEILLLLNCMKDRWITAIQMDGADLFIVMEVIILANFIILQLKKVRSMIKMEIKFMKKFIKFMIDI